MSLNQQDFDAAEIIDAFGQLSGLTIQVHQDFKPIYVSADCARLYGYSNAEDFMRLGSILDLVPEEFKERSVKRYQEIIRTGQSKEITQKATKIDGQEIWVRIQDRRIRYNKGYAVLTVLIDITDEVQAKEAHQKAANEYQQALVENKKLQSYLIEQEKQSALNSLLSGLSHQLNTPLGNILTSASVAGSLLNALDQDFSKGNLKVSDLTYGLQDIREAITIIEVAVDKSNQLIKRIKSMVTMTPVDDDNFNLKQLVDTVFSLYEKSSPKLKISTEVLIPNSIMFNSNTNTWMQLLSIFCDNTISHGLENKTQGRIRIEFTQTNAAIELLYSDDGNGIEQQYREHVFEPFYSSSMAKSTGLGLALAFNLVQKKLNGTIALAPSTFGAGTGILITIPMSVMVT